MNNKAKALIVEDNVMNLKLFQDLLELKGIEVIPLSEGVKALEYAKLHLPQLIILDIQLNNVSGLLVAEQIKKCKETANIPIVAVTAFAMAKDKETIMRSGCSDYIAKPIELDTFYNIVGKFLPID